MTLWYSNCAGSHKTQPRPVVAQPMKKPHATNAKKLFAKDHQEELCAATSSKMEQDNCISPGANLVVYHSIKKNEYSDLSPTE
jgi:hypothetical protein